MTTLERIVLRELQLRGEGTLYQLSSRVAASRSHLRQLLVGLLAQGLVTERLADKGQEHIWAAKA